jgi:hypothetical protein
MKADQLSAVQQPAAEVKRAPAQQQGLVWPYCANLFLGGWLICCAFTLDYGDPEVTSQGLDRLAEQRQLPPIASRAMALVVSDLLCGTLVLVFSFLSIARRYSWAPWVVSAIGLWLIFAPLVLWAPSSAVYANDSLIGTLAIAFSLLIPGVPGLPVDAGPETPPGWNYNPSSWLQRAPIVGFAFLGFLISRYLSAYQLGHLPTVWDPLFPDGTKKVLDSDVSLAWPISDAGLGAVSYLLEALFGLLGDTRRWRTMPWMVILFVVLVVPLGVVSIVLVVLQPLVVGAWCTLCLVTAAAMVVMISPALDEVIATLQFLAASRREGKPFWRTFWQGGVLASHAQSPSASLRRSQLDELASAAGLTSVPWNLVVSAALGIWLMAAPAVLGFQGAAAGNDQLLGALVVTFSIVAIGEVARAARLLNVPFGVWLLVSPWLLAGGNSAAMWNDLVIGAVLLLLSVPRGKVSEHFGSWDRYVF